MHIDCGASRRAVLFLFAHQDDEFGVFQHVLLAREAGYRVCCAYLTTGVFAGSDPTKREEESISVLGRLGVSRDEIHFPGVGLKIPDGQLMRNLDIAIDWLSGWIASIENVDTVFLPAWEGGHPDHDTLHAAVLIATSRGIPRFQLFQYPLYNGYRCWGPLFRVLSPLPANGQGKLSPIPWRRRMQFLRLCLSYPSQLKTWLGLFPFTLLHYFINGVETVQEVSHRRLRERPHDGPLYYERRGFSTWGEVQAAVDASLAREQLTMYQLNKQ